MKRKLHFSLSAFLLLIVILSQAQTDFTATYTFGSNGNVASFTYNGTIYDGVTFGNLEKVGVTSSSSTNNFRANGWPLGATSGTNDFTGEVDLVKYLGFSVSPVAGYKISIDTIIFGVGRSATGVRQSQWRGSSDNYAAIINNYAVLATNLTNNNGVLTNPDENSSWIGNKLTPGTTYDDLTSPAGFRFYLFNSEATAGTGGFQGILTIKGTFVIAGGNIPPSITGITKTPATDITSTMEVNIGATINDTDGAITNAQVKWGTATGTYPNTIPMVLAGKGLYATTAAIPAQVDGTTVYFVVEAADNESSTTTSPEQTYIVSDPATSSLPYSETFNTNLGDTYNYTVAGNKPWYFFNASATVNGFAGLNPEEHWLVLPGMNFNNYSNEVLTFTTYAQYGTVDANNYLKLFYSTDYTGIGDVALSTWTELAFAIPAGIGATEVSSPSGNIDLSAITGANIHLAFKYLSTTSPTRFRIDDISVQSQVVVVENPASFTATANGADKIDLTFAPNLNSDNVVLVYNPTGTFTDPSGVPPAVGQVFAGGTLLYNGTSSPQSHIGLSASETVYYKAFSYSGSAYSSGLTANATTEAGGGGGSNLTAGDIAFVAYATDAPDRFAFITFVDINANTEITFTDNGWKADNTWRTGENTGTWTAPAGGIAAGSVIQIEGTTVAGGGTMSTPLDGLNNNGDQIIAYQGNASSPDIVTAINMDWTVWQADATNSNTSAIPSGLTNNINANAVALENGYYNGPTSGSINFLRSAINNPANWTTNNSNQTWPTWTFIIGGGAVTPLIAVDPISLSGFSYLNGFGPSPEKSFTVVGSDLTEDISISPSENYEISTGTGIAFSATNPVIIPQIGGNVAATTIYVRLKSGLLTGTYNNEAISLTSLDADSKTVTCNGYVEGPVTLPYFEDFTDCSSHLWQTVSVASNRNWICGSGYMQANGFGGDAPSDDFLISPIFNFTANVPKVLSFLSYTQFNDVNHPHFTLLYTDNYTGDPSTTTWTSIIPNLPDQNSSIWTSSGMVDISSILGSNIRFAFRYTSSGTAANSSSLWRVDDFGITSEPFFTVTPVNLTGFDYLYGQGPSAEQFTTVSGGNLTGVVTVAPPQNFEVSLTSGSGFTQFPITINPIDGFLSQHIYVRLRNGLGEGNYNGNLTISVTGEDNANVSLSGTVTPSSVPTLVISPASLQNLNYIVGQGPSTSDYYVIEGSGLTGSPGNITIAAPANFEISLDDVNFSNTLLVPYYTSSLVANVIFVRLKTGLVSGNYTGAVSNSGGGAISFINVSGSVTSNSGSVPGIITQWNFNGTSTTTVPGGSSSPTPWFGVGTTSLSGGTTATFASGTASGGSTDPVTTSPPNYGWNTTSYPLQGTAPKSAGIQFNISTVGFSGISVQFDQRLSNTAANTWVLQYSTNVNEVSPVWIDAQTFTFTPAETGTGDIWYNNRSVDLSAVSELNNNPSAGFRIVSDFDPVAGTYVAARSTSTYGASSTSRFDMLTVSGEQNPIAPPEKLAFTSINGGSSPTIGQSFYVEVKSQDSNGNPASVTSSTTITLSKSNGSGVLSGTLSKVLNPGEHSVTFSDLSYNIAESGVSLTATAMGGNTLSPAVSTPFSVLSSATKLVFSELSPIGQFGVPLAAFNVLAHREDNSLDANFTGLISLEKVSGPGELAGTLAKQAVAGSASFSDIVLSLPGSYVLKANAVGLLSATSLEILINAGPAMTEDILPLTMVGLPNRLPYAFRATLSGLTPNATYKYINQAVIDADLTTTTGGSGNAIYVTASGVFIRTTGAGFTNPAQHAEFTTDATGSYSGWFMLEPTTHARFTPGNNVFMRIRLNNGAGGTTAVHYFTSQAVKVIGFGSEPNENQGTAIRATSAFEPGNFAFLYSADAKTARPVAGTSVESTGIDFSSVTSYPSYFRTLVAGTEGAWGTIVPNILPFGITYIEERSNASGAVVSTKTSSNGSWGQTITVNPTGGIDNVLVLDLDTRPVIVANPISINSLDYFIGNGPSPEQSFIVSGTNLTDDIIINSTSSFEISIGTGAQFIPQTEINLTQTGGVVNPVTVFTRLKAGLSGGTYAESIQLTSTGAISKTVALAGVVSTPAAEPTAHLTNLQVDATGMNSIQASWVDALPAATGYLIKGSASAYSDISAPVDGVIETEGLFAKYVAAGQQTASFTGLNPETRYYFKAFAYNGNGMAINYKTDGNVPQDDVLTQSAPALTNLVVPKYIQGVNGSNNNRVPYAFRAQLRNLAPNTTYRYINLAVNAADGPTSSGAGIPIFINNNEFIRSSNPGFTTSGNYGELTTDANGYYDGWFMLETTGNERFTPGQEVWMRIRLNNGQGGTNATYFFTSDAVTVLNFSQTTDASSGTAIRATSNASPKNFVFIYDNPNGSERPLYGTSVETTGIDFTSNTTYASFYRNNVAGVLGSWGGIVPNANFYGVRRVEERSLTTGNIIDVKVSDIGLWGLTNTVNPSGGLDNVLVLDLSAGLSTEKIAGQLKYYNPAETVIPTPNQQSAFYVQLMENGVAVRPPQLVKYNQTLGLDAYYEFANVEAGRTYSLKVWEQNQDNNINNTWTWNNWGGVTALDALILSFMTAENPVVEQLPWIAPTGVPNFSPHFFNVADVNNSDTLSAVDVLVLQYKMINTPGYQPLPGGRHNFQLAGASVASHATKKYPQAPETLFNPNGAYVSGAAADQVYYEAVLPTTLAGLNVFNVYFTATGDLNASYIPGAVLQSISETETSDIVTTKVGSQIRIPVILKESMEVAAMSLELDYSMELIDIQSVEVDGLVNVDKGKILVSWFEQKAKSFAAGEVIAWVNAVVKAELKYADALITIGQQTEFADQLAQPIDNVQLRTFAYTTTPDLENTLSISALVFPNPFNGHAKMQILLPEGGKCSILIYNKLGQEVMKREFNTSDVSMNLELNSDVLHQSGIYFYHVLHQAATKSYQSKGSFVVTE